MDILDSLMRGFSLRAKLLYAGGVCGPWVIDHNSSREIWFHLLTKGEGWVHSPAWASPLHLEKGDLILFLPHAEKHYLSYSPNDLRLDSPDARTAPLSEGSTGFVCGLLELDLPKAVLWQALPAEIFISHTQADPELSELIPWIIAESHRNRLGGFALIERLCDAMFVLTLRHCVEQRLVQPGFIQALRDKRMETVLSAIHREPWRAWTIQQLCKLANLSRSALIKRFDTLLGCPPMDYVIQWRMQIAASWLRESGMTIEKIAERCGYESTSAFSRAFKRCCGVSPGLYRRQTAGIEHQVIPMGE